MTEPTTVEPEQAQQGPRGSTSRFTPKVSARVLDAIALLIVAAAVLLPLVGVFTRPGALMEEGSMLVFPERLLAGDVPNLDFLHLYGPGSLWVLAGIYKVFGTSFEVERVFGLLQQLALVYGIFFLARPWGRRVAVVVACLMIVIMLPTVGISAIAWPGGLGLGLVGTLSALASRSATDDRRARWLAIVAGVLFGAALLYRPDLVVAVGLVVAVVVWKAPRPRVVALLGALVVTTALYLVQFAAAGFGTAFEGMVIEPIFDLRGGRTLPLPPGWNAYDGYLQLAGDTKLLSWPVSTLSGPHQLFLWFFALLASLAFLLFVSIRSVRRHPGSARSRTLLAVTLFGLGILPQALQRPDSTHVAWVSCVSMAFLPVGILELLRDPPGRATEGRKRLGIGVAQLIACAVPVLLFVVMLPNFTVRRYAEFSAQSFGRHRYEYPVEVGGRTFNLGDEAAGAAAQQTVDLVASIAKPGDRLFVGTGDLRKTPYSDAWLYYLFPDLTPATRYIELDPGVANARGSGLARDVKSADIVVQSTVWDGWDEPNDSRVFGPNRANEILERDFCVVGDFGYFRVSQRCDRQ